MLTATIIQILLRNQSVNAALDKSISEFLAGFTKQPAPSLEDRLKAVSVIVDSLDLSVVAASVPDYPQYFGALVAVCFDVAAASGRGVLVEDLYAAPCCFFFPVPKGEVSLGTGKDESGAIVHAVFNVKEKPAHFFAIERSDDTPPDVGELQSAYDDGGSDDAFLTWLERTSYKVHQLIGVKGSSAQTCRYVPKTPEVLGGVAVKIVPRSAETRKRLKATLRTALDCRI